MKESIKFKGKRENYYCCESARKITGTILLNLSGTIIQAIVSLLAVVIYIIGTYYDKDKVTEIEPDKTIGVILRFSEIIIASLIFADYLYNFIMTREKIKFILNPLNILDLVTAIPIFIQFIFGLATENLGFVRIFKIIRVMRIFRVYKIIVAPKKKDTYEEGKSEISRRLISAILTVLAVVFLSTGIVHYLNEQFPQYFRIVVPSLDSIQCASGEPFIDRRFEYYEVYCREVVKMS